MVGVETDSVDDEIGRQMELLGSSGVTVNLEIPRKHSKEDEICALLLDSMQAQEDMVDQEFEETVLKPPMPYIPETQAQADTPYDERRLYQRSNTKQTPTSASQSINSLLRQSVRTRSIRTIDKLLLSSASRNFDSPTVKNDYSGSTASFFQRELALLEQLSEGLFDDVSIDEKQSRPALTTKDSCPLKLFELSGQSTNLSRPNDGSPSIVYSFGTEYTKDRSSIILVHGTQFAESSSEALTLIPLTPSLNPPSMSLPLDLVVQRQLEATSSGTLTEIPPTFQPFDPATNSQPKQPSLERIEMSQMDLFGTSFSVSTMNTVEQELLNDLPSSLTTQTIPSLTGAIVASQPRIVAKALNPDQKLTVQIVESIADTSNLSPSVTLKSAIAIVGDEDSFSERFSGHDTVILPDSFDEDENPFTASQRELIRPVSPFFKFPKPTQLPKDDQQLDNVTRTAKKVNFAPTPIDSEASSSMHTASESTEDLQPSFDNSQGPDVNTLAKVSLRKISGPRASLRAEGKIVDLDEKLGQEGDASALVVATRTPLKITSRTTTPARSIILAPPSSVSKTLNGIIEALTPGKRQSIMKTPANPAAKHQLIAKRQLHIPTSVHKRTRSGGTPLRNEVRPSRESSSLKSSKQSSPNAKSPRKNAMISPNGFAEQDPLILAPGLLVWAKWKLQLYAPAVLRKKKSTTRDLWQVRPLHRRTATVDLTPKDLIPLRLLNFGDSILIIKDRRKYSTMAAVFSQWLNDDTVALNDGSKIALCQTVIHRALFNTKHEQWKQMIELKIPLDNLPTIDSGINSGPVSEVATESVDNGLQNLQHKNLFSNHKFLITGDVNKSYISSLIQDNAGVIIDEISPEYAINKGLLNRLILIGEGNPCRTAKYFMSVILGIHRIHPNWLDDCIKLGQLISFSPEHCLDSVPVKQDHNLFNLFDQVTLSFVGSTKYRQSCESIAGLPSASLLDPRKLASCTKTVIVVAESGDAIKPRLRTACLAAGHLLTDKSWFTDSILEGHVLPI